LNHLSSPASLAAFTFIAANVPANANPVALATLNCSLPDGQGSQVCVEVTTTGPGNPVVVQIGPCSGGSSSAHSPNPNSKNRVQSDCFNGDSWQIRPLVDWSLVDRCDDMIAKFIPC
jgi:hypothetical protein